eukprot:TRINITY_DN27724_c0_g1_i1.p1 TRINITY_DN27724_c0_g1~~TRINITY_DN27724_c0_g1_i1.p1  ORF type:complete len:549 (+),score=178.06 TRINITY_DN27724_c0_g1_i1:69-1715(+)
MPGGVAVHWFRKGLRLADNHALAAGLAEGPAHVLPIFILDKWHANPRNVGPTRFRFILESLQALDTSLKAAGVATGLCVLRGEPAEVFPAVWGAARAVQKGKDGRVVLSFDSADENEPHVRANDRRVMALASEHGVDVAAVESDHYLHNPNAYDSAGGGAALTTFAALVKVLPKLGKVAAPIPAPKALPFDAKLSAALLDNIAEEASTPIPSDSLFAPFTTSHFGGAVPDTAAKFPGGEAEGLARLKRAVIDNKKWVKGFDKPSTVPTALEPSTTVLSPYLTHGCVSARTVWDGIRQAHGSEPPLVQTTLSGQVLWRELWLLVCRRTPNVGRMEGNPLARQIPWDENPELVKAWEEGRTGYPFIDAIMTQLRTEGWIHHLARHMTACFLTRGDLWQSWEAGAKVFDRHLIDADWSLNNCNWMWLSCTAFFHQFFRCYSPVAFGQKYDKKGVYIRHYVPALKHMPDKYIYTPWLAPLDVQKKAKCVVGKDYPAPVVPDHTAASKANMDRMKKAFDANKAGAAAIQALFSGKRKAAGDVATAKKAKRVKA